MRAGAHPLEAVAVQCGRQLLPGRVDVMQARERHAVVIAPPRELAERERPRFGVDHAQPTLDRVAGVGVAPGPKLGACGFEPQQSVSWKRALQSADHAQRIVIAPSLVVDGDQREQRVDVSRTLGSGGLLDEAQAGSRSLPIPATLATSRDQTGMFETK